MAHVDQAVREMYGAVHMQLLGSCCQLDKLLLACLIMETNAQGAGSRPTPVGRMLIAAIGWLCAMLCTTVWLHSWWSLPCLLFSQGSICACHEARHAGCRGVTQSSPQE